MLRFQARRRTLSPFSLMLCVLLAEPGVARPARPAGPGGDGPRGRSAGAATQSPKLLLHVRSVTARDACAAGRIPACRDAVVRGDLSAPGSGAGAYVYLLVARGSLPGVAGLQCGLAYESNRPDDIANLTGLDIFSWTLCATLEFPSPGVSWPAPGSGTMITWDGENQCQRDSLAVAGYFYLGAYSPDLLRVTVRPIDGRAKVANCANAETNLEPADLGSAAFSRGAVTAGCNPCHRDCAPPVEHGARLGLRTPGVP